MNSRRQNRFSPKNRKVSLPSFLRHCALSRALRSEVGFKRGGPGRHVLIVPPGRAADDYEEEAKTLAAGHVSATDSQHVYRTDDVYTLSADDDKKRVEMMTTLIAMQDRVLLLVDTDELLNAHVRLAVDGILHIQPPTMAHWRAGLKLTKGIAASDQEIEELQSLPEDLVLLALRRGQPIATAIQAVRDCMEKRDQNGRRTGVGVENLAGFGPVSDWASDLARDLADWRQGHLQWSEVDRGLLLSGPPGTGKTTFARALANTCDAHLIATSIAQWQAAGHLGDMLKAMLRSFREAKQNAPSILFIDEIDAVGDRRKFSGSSAHYCREVVNGLLEAIDGASGREGVIIIGACNDADLIDPALLRSGRLDRHYVVPLPDQAARFQILRHHSDGEEVPAEDLLHIASLTEGFSGADLAALARRSRRRARKSGRPVNEADFLAELPERLALPESVVWATAVHEAGHASVGILLGYFDVVRITVEKTYMQSLEPQAAGRTVFRPKEISRQGREAYLAQITRHLAGLAAEKVFFGFYGDGGGGGDGSDLQKANDVATLMDVAMGLNGSLSFFGATSPLDLQCLRQNDSALADRIHRLLASCFDRAEAIIKENRLAVQSLAEAVMANGNLEGKPLEEALSLLKSQSSSRSLVASGD